MTLLYLRNASRKVVFGTVVMSGRIKKVTQAELERAIRAIRASGLEIRRIVALADGYAIEIGERLLAPAPAPVPRPVL